MGMSRILAGFSTRTVPPATSEPKPAVSTAPNAPAGSPAEPASAAFRRMHPGWTRGLMEKLGLKKARPPVHLAGAMWMKQHAEQQRVKFHSNMTSATLWAATQKIPNMSNHLLKLLAEDIHAVLTIYSDDNRDLQKAADRYFRTTYAKLFEEGSYTFEDQRQRDLMKGLRDLIHSQNVTRERPVSVAAVTSVTAVAPAAPIVPIDFPGFNPVATNLAFEFIRNAYLERVQIAHDDPIVPLPAPAPGPEPAPPETSRTNRMTRIRRSLQQSETQLHKIIMNARSLRVNTFIKPPTTNKPAAHMSATQPPAKGNLDDRSIDAQRRANEAIRRAVADMERGNMKFGQWLGRNNIEAVSNSGVGLNCLIIALLQHATGAYESAFEPNLAAQAAQLRQQLGIEAGMLYSDDTAASQIVEAINTMYGTRMVPVEVQADEQGLPVISTPLEQIPEGDRVVIWQRGNHFEALRAKDAHEPS